MERQVLLDHLRATHFESGNRGLAVADARQIAQFLRSNVANRVLGIGSAFDASRPFTERSDIDLVAEGIDPRKFYAVSAEAAAMTKFSLDLTPVELATANLRHLAHEEDVEL